MKSMGKLPAYSSNLKHEYWLIFKQSDRWYRYFTKKGFGHIGVIVKDSYNWLFIDPTYDHLEWFIPAVSVKEDYPKELINLLDVKIIKITKYQSFHGPALPIINISPCVAFVRYLLGIKKNFITPYGLYKFFTKLPVNKYEKHGIIEVSIL